MFGLFPELSKYYNLNHENMNNDDFIKELLEQTRKFYESNINDKEKTKESKELNKNDEKPKEPRKINLTEEKPKESINDKEKPKEPRKINITDEKLKELNKNDEKPKEPRKINLTDEKPKEPKKSKQVNEYDFIEEKLEQAKYLKQLYLIKINEYNEQIKELDKLILQYTKEIEEAKKKVNYFEEIQTAFRKKYGTEPYLNTFIELYNEVSKNKNITLEIIKDEERGYILLVDAGGLNDYEKRELKLLKDRK